MAEMQQASGVPAERLAEVHEAVERLNEPYRSLVERVVLGDEDLYFVSSAVGIDPAHADALFLEALDMLSLEAKK